MKSPITKLAAAAVIVAIAMISIVSLDKLTPAAYALDQTIQATHSVNYIHVKSFWPPHEEPTEAWVEFDVAGKVRNVRMHLPAWHSPYDGQIKVVWKDKKAHFWVKKKNIYGIAKDNVIAEMYFRSIEMLDPKMALQNLKQLKSQEKVDLDINQPKDKTSPIIVTATLLEEMTEQLPMTDTEREITKLIILYKGSAVPFSKFVLFIDQATKLVTSIEFYEQKEGKERCAAILEYYDYNQPIAAQLFTLEDEVPDDAMRGDQTTQEVGIIQGQLSDKEVAVELVRQFLEAMIAKDYDKAARLFGGTPVERIEKTYGDIRFIRIVSIGPGLPCSEAGDSDDHYCFGIHVTCVVEIEENGQIKQWKPGYVGVRQVHGQPDRWEIIGGFRGI